MCIFAIFESCIKLSFFFKTISNIVGQVSKFVLIFFFLVIAQTAMTQKVYPIQSSNDKIKIDGILSELVWQTAASGNQFVVNYPEFGKLSKHRSEIKLVYTEDAIYFAGELYDTKPDSVLSMLSQRDDFGNADWIGIQIDPYGNNVNAFAFYVTAAGVELDALMDNEDEDFSWNAVWKSAVQLTDFGWTFEVEIPYAAIRFPKSEQQAWNVNFVREVRRNRERSCWNPVDPAVYGIITQAGRITGLNNIKSPLRLSFTPYTAAYSERYFNSETQSYQWFNDFRAGMDLKYGVSDAFTLDVSLIPDFGQVIADNVILNLGPFEVQFDENRSFFKEGTELFGIGDVFYSRRIGGRPYNQNNLASQLETTDEVVSNPATAPLLNASKFSGRTKNGLGIGLFNAIEGRTFAEVKSASGTRKSIETNPLTNYSVFVLSQNLKNNSTISFLNTFVAREGIATDASVSVGDFSLFSPNGKYQLKNTFKISNQLRSNETETGHSLNLSIGKVQGIWNYNFEYIEESDRFNSNDLGFLLVNNKRIYTSQLRWNDFVPRGRFLRKSFTINSYLESLYAPDLFTQFSVDGLFFATFKNFLSAGLSFEVLPFGRMDHFESRSFGQSLAFAPSVRLGGFYSSDYSKPFALDFDGYLTQFTETNQKIWSGSISPRIRFSDRFFVVYTGEVQYFFQDYGFIRASNYNNPTPNEIFMGTRNRLIFTNTLNAEYTFTNRMGITARVRYYSQEVNYNYFSTLNRDGLLALSNYLGLDEKGNSLHSTQFNTFTVDLNYRWVFIPGSELRIGWKNTIFSSLAAQQLDDYTWFQVFGEPQTNTFSVKLLVFVDSLYAKKLKRKK